VTKQMMTCANCGLSRPKRKSSYNKYCSISCQHQLQTKERAAKWLDGYNNFDNRAIRSILKLLRGDQCEVCKITEWNGDKIVFEVEHKDGNSDNNSPDNVCLICPNCHSQTPTYKGANKGNGRHFRRQRYAEGKSY